MNTGYMSLSSTRNDSAGKAHNTWGNDISLDPNSPPVERTDVAAWRKLADRWALCGHPEGLLLSGAVLESAQEWAKGHPDETTEVERDLIDESRRAQASARRALARQRASSFLLTLVLLAALVMVRALFQSREERNAQVEALQDAQAERDVAIAAATRAATRSFSDAAARQKADARRREAEHEAALAESRALSAASQLLDSQDRELPILLAVQALRWANETSPTSESTRSAFEALYRALGREEWQAPIYLANAPQDAQAIMAWPSGDGRLLSDGPDGVAVVWDAATGAKLLTLPDSGGPIRDAAWSSDGKRLAVVSTDGSGGVWDALNGARLSALLQDCGAPRTVSWSPDGKQIAVVGSDSRAVICDPFTGRELVQLSGPVRKDSVMSWDPGSGQVVGVSSVNVVMVWEADTGDVISRLVFPDQEALAAISLGENKVGVWTSDSSGASYSIWNAATRDRLIHHTAPSLPTRGLVTIIVRDDGPFYFAGVGDLTAFACSRVRRNLSRAEWERYVGSDTPYLPTCPNLP